MTHRASHLIRDLGIGLVAACGLAIVGWIIVGYGFALAIAMMLGVAMLAAIPLFTIYYEERDLPRDRGPRPS